MDTLLETEIEDRCRCFVPSCRKMRQHFPNKLFLGVPNTLKETWCRALGRNCPQRYLYVCEDHINIEQDCFRRYGKLCVKDTANLVLTRSYCEEITEENETKDEDSFKVLPTSGLGDCVASSKCDSSTQCQLNMKNKAVVAKPTVRSVGCSANIKVTVVEKVMPSLPSSTTASRTSTPSLFEPSSPSSSSTTKENVMESKDFLGRNHILKLIKENPKMYLGVPKQFYWIIDFLAKQCKLRPLHVLVTLFKLKQNDSLIRIGHHFSLAKSTVLDLLKLSIPNLASYLQNFIYLPEPVYIKKTLPTSFKARFANVQCIIDCFEIQMEKPSDPLVQARTWSQYKSCNTIKYLVACCPNGFICFISKGYGERISDKAITECSGFVEILPPGAAVLADRGFKGIETLLTQRQIKLLRPPSVSSKENPTKQDVIQGKIIASLRIHVERVIRRIREFSFLKPRNK